MVNYPEQSNGKTAQQPMVIISLAVASFCCMLIFYHILIIYGLVPPGTGESAQKENLIKIENFLINQDPEVLVIGSSQTGVVLSQVDNKLANLSLSGHSSLDGLRIMEHNGKTPKILLVELGRTLVLAPDLALEKSSHGLRSLLLSISPLFWTKYQPSSVLLGVLNRMKGKKDRSESPVIDTDRIEALKTHFSTELSEDKKVQFAQNLREVKQRLLSLRTRGVRVYLFEVPIDSRIENTPTELTTRQIIEKAFPKGEFILLPTDKAEKWNTSDGFHLLPIDAVRFGERLLKQLPGDHR